MEDLNKIILTAENAGFLRENPCFREGMTAQEYEEEEKEMYEFGRKHGSLDGYIPSWYREDDE